MNKQQQELYDKLLKKVNEFCLGQAAEDVIECIDALVENYEDNLCEAEGFATHYAEVLKKYEDADLQSIYERLKKSHTTFRTTPLNNIDNKLKALEIIKNKRLDVSTFLNRIERSPEFYSSATKMNTSILKITSKPLTQEEYELLKEVLK